MKKMPKMDKEAEFEALVHLVLTLLAPFFSFLLCFDDFIWELLFEFNKIFPEIYTQNVAHLCINL